MICGSDLIKDEDGKWISLSDDADDEFFDGDDLSPHNLPPVTTKEGKADEDTELTTRFEHVKKENEELSKLVEELQKPVENLTAVQKVRMELARRLMEKAGMTDEVLSHQGNKQKAATVMSLLLDICNNNKRCNPAQTCATYLSSPMLPKKCDEKTINKLNSLLSELNIGIQL